MIRMILSITILMLSIPLYAKADIPCQCGREHCECFIQYGDRGPAVEFIELALVEQGFLVENTADGYFDQQTYSAVCRFQAFHSIPCTGMMDDETLTLLLWSMLPEELDEARPDLSPLIMWVPTDGGIRHHDNPKCCSMTDPRLVTQRNALAMEMLPCGRCKPSGYYSER